MSIPKYGSFSVICDMSASARPAHERLLGLYTPPRPVFRGSETIFLITSSIVQHSTPNFAGMLIWTSSCVLESFIELPQLVAMVTSFLVFNMASNGDLKSCLEYFHLQWTNLTKLFCRCFCKCKVFCVRVSGKSKHWLP